MTTIEIRVPDPILRQAQELALKENLPVDELMTLAVTHAVSVWNAERKIAGDSRVHGRKRFLEMLQQALDSETPTSHRLT